MPIRPFLNGAVFEPEAIRNMSDRQRRPRHALGRVQDHRIRAERRPGRCTAAVHDTQGVQARIARRFPPPGPSTRPTPSWIGGASSSATPTVRRSPASIARRSRGESGLFAPDDAGMRVHASIIASRLSALISIKAPHPRRGAADCSQHRKAAGAAAQDLRGL